MYKRKTEDEYQLHMYAQYGWEEVTTETTYKEIVQRHKDYRENCPEYSYKIVRKRVKIINKEAGGFFKELSSAFGGK